MTSGRSSLATIDLSLDDPNVEVVPLGQSFPGDAPSYVWKPGRRRVRRRSRVRSFFVKLVVLAILAPALVLALYAVSKAYNLPWLDPRPVLTRAAAWLTEQLHHYWR